MVIWSLANMGRTAGIVAMVNFSGSKWRQAIQIWCYRGLGSSKGWRERSCPLTADPPRYPWLVWEVLSRRAMWSHFAHILSKTHIAMLTKVSSEDTAYRADKAGSFVENSVGRINGFHEKNHCWPVSIQVSMVTNCIGSPIVGCMLWQVFSWTYLHALVFTRGCCSLLRRFTVKET